MTYEQVRTLATQHEPAMAVLIDRGADRKLVRAALVIVACKNLVDLEILVNLDCKWLADRRTSACEAERNARSFERLLALVARYRKLLGLPQTRVAKA